ncbi:MAG: phage minor capsid protein, partial [Clostridiales bacterium]|nr:phage minor capsid protein [Clostridiales bacterium]
MLTPDYLASCTDYLLGMYDALQTSLMEDMARRIVKTGTMTDTAAYQAKCVQTAGALMQDVTEKVANLTNLSNEEIERLFQEAGVESMKNDAQPLLKAGYDIDLTLSPAMSSQLEAAIKKTQGDMTNLTLTTGSTAAGQYLEATNKAYMMVTSGGFSYSDAIARAIKECASEGNFVSYASGTKSRVDVAVRRSVLTAVNQTAAKMTESYSADLGAEYYETSAHFGARPTHQEWQGQVFKIEGSDRNYPNFADSTGYGTGDGLCGWNCRHSFYPYWPDISERAYSEETLEEYASKSY